MTCSTCSVLIYEKHLSQLGMVLYLLTEGCAGSLPFGSLDTSMKGVI